MRDSRVWLAQHGYYLLQGRSIVICRSAVGDVGQFHE